MSRLKFIVSMLIFGTIGLFVHYIGMPSSVIAAVRGFIGTVFLLVVCAVKKHRISFGKIKKYIPLLCISGAAMGANWILLFESYKYTSLAAATLCYYMAPIIVIVLSPVFLKEKLTVVKLICTAVSLVGMIFVSGIFTDEGGFSGMKGVLLALGAAVLYASVMILNKRLTDIESFDRTILQLAASFIVLIPYCLFTVKPADFDLGSIKTSIIVLIAVGIVHTGIAYYLYFSAIPHMSGQSIAILSYIDPVTAVILSAAVPVLGGKPDVYIIVGALLIIGASLVIELYPQRKPKGIKI